MLIESINAYVLYSCSNFDRSWRGPTTRNSCGGKDNQGCVHQQLKLDQHRKPSPKTSSSSRLKTPCDIRLCVSCFYSVWLLHILSWSEFQVFCCTRTGKSDRSQGSASMHVPGLSWASTRHLTWDQCTYPSARTLTWHWTDGRVHRSISAKFQRHSLSQPLPTVQSTDIAVLYYITPISDR